MKRAVFFEKVLTLVLTLSLVVALPWDKLMLCYILLGHGHFSLAYYYQYKAGKAGKAYLFSYLGCFLVLSAWYFAVPDARALGLLTTAWFLLHLSLDELYLMRYPMRLSESPLHLGRCLELAPGALIYLGFFTDRFIRLAPTSWGYNIWTDRAIMLSLWLMVPYFILLAQRRHKLDGKSLYFLSGGFFLGLLSQTAWLQTVPSPKVLGFLIIYHYLSWYVHYIVSLPKGPPRRRFLKHVLIANTVVLLIFLGRHDTFLVKWVFGIECYYIWAILHIVSSTRTSDLLALFRIPGKRQSPTSSINNVP